MDELIVLASGSKANSTLISHNGFYWLFDLGLSCRKLEQILSDLSINPQKIKKIFISHNHLDHCQGAKTFSNKWSIPVLMNENTAGELKRRKKNPKNVVLFKKFTCYSRGGYDDRSYSHTPRCC